MQLNGELFPEAICEPWRSLNEAKLAHYPWKAIDSDYTPECAARVGWNAAGVHVLMYANEPIIRAVETTVGGDIYLDSCLEFFLAPHADSQKYVNCEVNPMAVMHIGVGEGRYGRNVFLEVPEGFNPVHSTHNGGWWAISYTIPTSFLKENFDFIPESCAHVRGNFFKCGDYERHVHHGIFYPNDMAKPDYHRPEVFADMMLE